MRIVKVIFAVLAVLSLSATAAPGGSYHLLNKYVLGGEGGWDYLTVDSASHRLFISRGNHVMVVDTESGKVVGDIANTPGSHGIALAPEFNRGFVSSGGDSVAVVFDMKTLAEVDRVKTGERPDAIIYDPASKRVFTFNARGQDATAIDAATGKVAGSVPLGGKPEFAAADDKGHVYVNIEDKSQIVEFDSKKLAVLHTWPLAPCEEPSGLAMDTKHRRLFAGCHNKMMAVVNADTGAVVATPPIDTGVDANKFDPGTELAFSSNGSGTLTVVHEDSPDKYTVVETVQTARGARTMALDTTTHNVFLVTAESGPPPAPTTENPRPRPTMVPGTFQLLVYGMK